MFEDERTGIKEALLLPVERDAGLRVGGLGLQERWEKGLGRVGIRVRTGTDLAIRSALAEATATILVADAGAVLDFDAMAMLAASRAGAEEIIAFRDDRGSRVPALLLGADAAHRMGGALPVASLDSLSAHATKTVPLPGACWSAPQTRREADGITRSMLARLRGRPGGLVARLVNRHVSTRWTYWLLKTRLTPNQITTLGGLLAVAASAAMLQAGWVWGALGGLLMQVSSILDGCDGEVARIRYQQSEFGKWYDSAWDEVVNALFLAAVGRHVAITEGPGWEWASWAGPLAGIANFLYGAANFHCKWVHGIGLYWWFDRPPAPRPPDQPPPPPTWWSEFKTLTGRDAYLFLFFLAALADLLPWLLVGISVISGAIFLLLFVHIAIVRATW